MSARPYVLLSCATSIDGYIDDASDDRLALSNPEDFDRVDAVRATCDAILVGAGTVRTDNPRLMIRSQARSQARLALGLSATPIKVTISGSGSLDPASAFFTTGDVAKLVYCASRAMPETSERLAAVATVIDAGEPIKIPRVLANLADRGIRRLMVEGGSGVHTQFLTEGLADELQLVIAPFFVGDPRAPRFALTGTYPWTANHRARLAEVRQIGDVALHRYALSDRFD